MQARGGGQQVRSPAAASAKDDYDEDDDAAAQEGDLTVNDAAAPAGEGDDALVGGKRPRAPRITFRETHLLSQQGLWTLYNQFQTLPLKRSAGHEAHDMELLMTVYRRWAKDLFPKNHSSDTLARIAGWSGKTLIKNAVASMRMELEVPRAQGIAAKLSKYNDVSAAISSEAMQRS